MAMGTNRWVQTGFGDQRLPVMVDGNDRGKIMGSMDSNKIWWSETPGHCLVMVDGNDRWENRWMQTGFGDERLPVMVDGNDRGEIRGSMDANRIWWSETPGHCLVMVNGNDRWENRWMQTGFGDERLPVMVDGNDRGKIKGSMDANKIWWSETPGHYSVMVDGNDIGEIRGSMVGYNESSMCIGNELWML